MSKTNKNCIYPYARWIIIILNIVVITMVGLVRTAYAINAFTFSIVPMAFCVAIVLFARDYRPFRVKKYYLWDVLLSGLFIMMLSAEEILKMLLKMDDAIFNDIFKIVYLPVLVTALLVDMDYVLDFSLAMRAKRFESVNYEIDAARNMDTSNEEKFLGIYYQTWLVIAVSFVFAVAYFPGNINNDFDPEWVMGGHPVWSDWHTVGFSFFVRLCTLIIRKPFMVTVGQATIFYVVTNYSVGFIKRRFPAYRKLPWVFICLYIFFGFYCIMYIGAMMKDNNSAPLLLAFGVAILDYVLSPLPGRREYINLAIFGFLAAIFRHAMIAIVVVTMIVLLIGDLLRDRKTKSVSVKKCFNLGYVVLVIVVAYALLTEVFAFRILKAERNPAYLKYSTPMNMAASMAYRNREVGLYIDDDIVALMEQVIPLEKWAEYYCPWDADVIARPWHEIGDKVEKLNDSKIAMDIMKVNIWYLSNHPKEYILSFFDLNSSVWEITRAKDLIMYCPSPAGDFTNIHHMRKGAFFEFAEAVKMDLADTAIGKAIFYRGGIYLFTFAIITVVMFIKRRVLEWVGMIPILLYAASLMVSIPQEGAHYTMGFSLYAVLFGVVACVIECNMGKESAS